jgi:hypothetical protein
VKKTITALAIGAAAIGMSIAPSAAADDDSNCQTVGGSTVCAQGGDVRNGDQLGVPPDAIPPDVGAPPTLSRLTSVAA